MVLPQVIQRLTEVGSYDLYTVIWPKAKIPAKATIRAIQTQVSTRGSTEFKVKLVGALVSRDGA